MGLSEQLIEDSDLILEANKKDLDNAKELDLLPSLVDRLTLTKESLRLASSPINEITSMVSVNNIGDVIALLEQVKKKFGDNVTAFEFISRSCLVAIRDFLGHIKLPFMFSRYLFYTFVVTFIRTR